MIQVIDGEIRRESLPVVGELKDGSTVSGYHLLDEEILIDEGWLPLEDIPPEYDEESQYIVFDDYEVLENKVIKKYRIVNNPERYPNQMEQLPDYLLDVDMRLTMQELGL